MTKTISARDFLKVSGAAAGAWLGSCSRPGGAGGPLGGQLNAAADSGYIPSMCEMCVWRCGLLAKVEERAVVKLEGNPDHPAFEREAVPARPIRPDEHLRPGPGADPADPGGQTRRGQVPQGLLGRSAGPGRREHAGHQDKSTARRRWSFRPRTT